MDKLTNQGVNTAGIQFYITHQESVLLDIVTKNNIYNNYSHTSYVDWKIEKTTEAHPKKLELNINKSETDLKKIDFNINVNDNEINDMNDEEAVHSSNDLTNDGYNNIEDNETQLERTNRNNSFYNLVDKEVQSSPLLEDRNGTNN